MDDLDHLSNGRLVRYEDLCARPAQGFKDLFGFCGLDWNPQTDAFLAASISQAESDYYSVYKDPLASANKWRKELDSGTAEALRSQVREHPVGRWYFDE